MPVVVVTGANRGIGLEFVRQYAAEGWTVIATARNLDAARDLAAIPGVTCYSLDVCDEASIANFAAGLGDQPIDLLINNAGVYGPKEGAITRPDWRSVIEANTIAPYFVTMALIDHVRASEGQTIATITSKMGSMADNSSGGAFIYRSSKAAVNAVMKSMAEGLREEGIKVSLLHPGWVQTDMGGANALITTETSVSGMRSVLATLTLDQSGRFYAFDGQEVPW